MDLRLRDADDWDVKSVAYTFFYSLVEPKI